MKQASTGDVVLLTGASRGVGLAIAGRLLSEGYTVVALNRSLSAELGALLATFDNAHWFEFDLARLDTIQSVVARVVADVGPIYALINNAAVGHDGLLSTQHDSEILELLTLNLAAPILLCKYAGRQMLPQRRGRIVNVSSVTALTGYSGLAAYGATKAGLVGLTKGLARELGRANITVNVVAPGYMETEMTAGLDSDKLAAIRRRSALGRLVNPTDVAASVSYLLGPDGASITGTTVVVDAGNVA